MAEYYLSAGATGTNSGTITNPWNAVSAMNTSYSPGDIIHCAGTLNSGFIDWNWTTHETTFQQWEDADQCIAGTADGHCLIVPDNVSGLVVDGIHGYQSGIPHNGVRVDNCFDVTLKNLCLSGYGTGIAKDNNDYANQSLTLVNVSCLDCTYDGIRYPGTNGTLTLSSCLCSSNGTIGFNTDCDSGNVSFYDCSAFHNGHQGFLFNGTTDPDIYLYRCVAGYNGKGGFVPYNAGGGKLENCLAYYNGQSHTPGENNNFGRGGAGGGGGIEYLYCTAVSANGYNFMITENNSKVINCISKEAGTRLIRDDSASGTIIDHNCYYDSGGFSGERISTTYNSFSTWASSTGYDSNSFFEDPLFIDEENGNYTLTATSPCIEEASSVPYISEDILQNLRDASNPDIGCYEYISQGTNIEVSSAVLQNGLTILSPSIDTSGENIEIFVSYFSIGNNLLSPSIELSGADVSASFETLFAGLTLLSPSIDTSGGSIEISVSSFNIGNIILSPSITTSGSNIEVSTTILEIGSNILSPYVGISGTDVSALFETLSTGLTLLSPSITSYGSNIEILPSSLQVGVSLLSPIIEIIGTVEIDSTLLQIGMNLLSPSIIITGAANITPSILQSGSYILTPTIIPASTPVIIPDDDLIVNQIIYSTSSFDIESKSWIDVKGNIQDTIYSYINKQKNIVNIYKEIQRSLLYIFSNLHYIDSENNLTKIKCIPANQERAIAKIRQEDSIILPIMSISQINIKESTDRRRYNYSLIMENYWSDEKQKAIRVLSEPPKPITLFYGLNIWTKYMEDMDQISSEINLLFNPDLEIPTKYNTLTKSFIVDEQNSSILSVDDGVDRLIQKMFIIQIDSYIPSPKFLYTSTGEIEVINIETSLYNKINNIG